MTTHKKLMKDPEYVAEYINQLENDRKYFLTRLEKCEGALRNCDKVIRGLKPQIWTTGMKTCLIVIEYALNESDCV